MNSLMVLNEYIPFIDAVLYGLIGFVFVFIGIGILIAIVSLVGFIMQKTAKKSVGKKKEAPTPPQTQPAPLSDEVPDEIKAAIMAALMAYYSQEKPKCEFVVKKIRKI